MLSTRVHAIRHKGLPAATIFTVAFLLLSAGTGSSDAGKTNLLLISLDTVRTDHLSTDGHERDTSPFLRKLASEGARFSEAYSSSATTGPSHATLFTSLYPFAHGILKNGMTLGAEHPTLAEFLHQQGYESFGVVSSFILDRRFGFARGFDQWDDDFDRATASYKAKTKWKGFDVSSGFDRRGNDATDTAIHWLESRSEADRPFFLFVHYFDPHAPYDPPETYRSRFANEAPATSTRDRTSRLYDGEIAFVDDQVRRLVVALDSRGLARRTLVVVTSDHGEGLMQRGAAQHGVHIYDEAVRVPLIMRLPGVISAGSVYESPLPSVDLLPTLIELLTGAAPTNGRMHGKSFAATLLTGSKLDPERPVFLTRRHYKSRKIGNVEVSGMRFALRLGDWKYFGKSEQGPAELYDLSNDPGELDNLVATLPRIATTLRERLLRWRSEHGSDQPAPLELGPKEREGLKALGYVE